MKYFAKSFSLGFVSDSHNWPAQLDTIRAKHPDIKEWFHLGDLFSFNNNEIAKTPKMMEWFKRHKKDYSYIAGNHDAVIMKSYFGIELKDKEEYLREVQKNIRVLLPDQKELLLFHSKPDSLWDFVEKTYTQREFEDDYPLDDNTQAVIIGHNHQQFKLTFPYIDAEIWSIGSSRHGEYAIYNNGKIEFKKL